MTYERPPPMASTMSPGCDALGHVVGSLLDAAWRGHGVALQARYSGGERTGTRDRRVWVPTGPDVGDDDMVGKRQRRSQLVEHGGRPMVGQRLMRQPDGASRKAITHRGQGRPDRRRMMAVVIDDEHAARLAFDLEAPGHTPNEPRPAEMPAEVTPARAAAAADARRIGAIVATGQRQVGGDGADSPGQADEVEARAVEPVAHRAGLRAYRQEAAAPVDEPGGERRSAATVDTDDSVPRPLPRCAKPGLECGHDCRLGGEDIGVVPLRVEDDCDVGSIGIEVASIFVRLDDEYVTPPPTRRGRRSPGQISGHQGAHEGGRVPAVPSKDMHEPRGRRGLPVRAGNGHQPSTLRGCGVSDDLLPGLHGDVGPSSGHKLRVVRPRSMSMPSSRPIAWGADARR